MTYAEMRQVPDKGISMDPRILAERDMLVFLRLHGIRTEAARPADLRSHLFLAAPYRDMSPLQVCMKSAQVGWSTLSIVKTIWVAKTRGYSIAYTLPTSSDAQEFVRTKVNPIVQQNPILKAYVQEGDNISEKRVGNSNIFYRGSFSERQAISFSADLNVHDEADRSDQKVLSTYSSRLQHSSYKGEWRFSNPSVPGNGVSAQWALSDQKHWFIRCGACNERQYLSWPDSIDQDLLAYVCKKCRRPLTDDDRRRGEWVKRFRDGKPWSGYWVSLMMAPWVSAAEVVGYFRSKPIDYFHNFVLGLPYAGEGNTVSKEDILGNCLDDEASKEMAVVGCDSGLVKHWVAGNQEGIFGYGKTGDWDDIRRMMDRNRKWILVMDAMPDLTEPRRIVQEYPGRAFICHYGHDRKTMSLIRWGEGGEAGTVMADRNRLIQVVVDEFSSRRIPIFGRKEAWEAYWSHWDGMFRTTEPDSVGNHVFKWDKADGNDHWCLVAGTRVLTGDGWKPIEDVAEGDMAMTRKGLRRVMRSWLVKEGAETVALRMSNGRTLRGTPDHKVMTDHGWVRLDALHDGDILFPCERMPSSSTGSNSGATRDPGGAKAASITSLGTDGAGPASGVCTRKSGNRAMGPFPKATTSTMSTGVRSTTTSPTSRRYLGAPIAGPIPQGVFRILRTGKGTPAILGASVPCRQRGIRLKGASPFTVRSPASSSSRNLWSSGASNAGDAAAHPRGGAGSSAAGNVAAVGTPGPSGRADVYNLTVEGEHEYFAEGVLVANCHATSYWRVGMDRLMAASGGSVMVPRPGIRTSPEVDALGNVPAPDVKAALRRKERGW